MPHPSAQAPPIAPLPARVLVTGGAGMMVPTFVWPPLRAIVRDVAAWLCNGGRGGD